MKFRLYDPADLKHYKKPYSFTFNFQSYDSEKFHNIENWKLSKLPWLEIFHNIQCLSLAHSFGQSFGNVENLKLSLILSYCRQMLLLKGIRHRSIFWNKCLFSDPHPPHNRHVRKRERAEKVLQYLEEHLQYSEKKALRIVWKDPLSRPGNELSKLQI